MRGPIRPLTFRSPSPGDDAGGFTLVEILVSMAVLTLLILLISQLIGGASATTTSGQKRLDAESQARLSLDRLSQDFSKMLQREDIDFTFSKTPGNDSLSFYCQTDGYADAGSPPSNRTLSVVGYRIKANAMERGARSIGWSGMTFSALSNGIQTQLLQTPNSLPTVDSGGGTSNYEILGDQVFRLEFCYLVKGNAGSPPVLTATTPAKLSDIAAVVIGIAVLDARSRALVPTTSYPPLINALPEAVDGQDIATLWSPIASDSTGLAVAAGIPRAAASSLRIYQRYFYLSSQP